MPNSLQSSAIASPASRRATNCSLSSITEHSFQGITPSPSTGRKCYLRVRYNVLPMSQVGPGLYPFVPSRSGLRANTAVVQRAIVDSPESRSRHAVKNSLHNTTPSFVEILTEIPNHLRKFRPQ